MKMILKNLIPVSKGTSHFHYMDQFSKGDDEIYHCTKSEKFGLFLLYVNWTVFSLSLFFFFFFFGSNLVL